jgi:hypothetical protein
MFAQTIFEELFDFRNHPKEKLSALQTVAGWVKPAAQIRREGAQFPEAAVYRVPDGRFFYVPVDVEADKIYVSLAQCLVAPSSSLFMKPECGSTHLPTELGPRGEKAGIEVQEWLTTAFYGYEKAARLFPQF